MSIIFSDSDFSVRTELLATWINSKQKQGKICLRMENIIATSFTKKLCRCFRNAEDKGAGRLLMILLAYGASIRVVRWIL